MLLAGTVNTSLVLPYWYRCPYRLVRPTRVSSARGLHGADSVSRPAVRAGHGDPPPAAARAARCLATRAVSAVPRRAPTSTESRASCGVPELREQIERRGWSLRQLALRSGVHHTHVSRVLNGHRPASNETIIRLRLALAGASWSADDDLAAMHLRAVGQLLLDDPSLDAVGVQDLLAAYRQARQATRERRARRS